jgi:hypothetical protein
MWQENIVAYLKILCWNSLEKLRKTMKTVVWGTT